MTAVAKVVDLGHASFERFFGLSRKSASSTKRGAAFDRAIILFAADPHPMAIKAYADLRRRSPGAMLVPVFNEAILQGTQAAR